MFTCRSKEIMDHQWVGPNFSFGLLSPLHPDAAVVMLDLSPYTRIYCLDYKSCRLVSLLTERHQASPSPFECGSYLLVSPLC
jgi:hypothetical protein